MTPCHLRDLVMSGEGDADMEDCEKRIYSKDIFSSKKFNSSNFFSRNSESSKDLACNINAIIDLIGNM